MSNKSHSHSAPPTPPLGENSVFGLQCSDVVPCRNEGPWAKKLITETQTIKGKGDPAISVVLSGAGGFTEDTVKILEAKGTESNEDFPDFEIMGRVFSSLA